MQIERLGAHHVNRDITEIQVDEKNLLVTAPAYMCETKVCLHTATKYIGSYVSIRLQMPARCMSTSGYKRLATYAYIV